MSSFSDIASALRLPGFCMRKNPSPKEQLQEHLRMLGISFSLYLISYWYGFHSLCLLSLASMNMLTFQAGITFHYVYSKPIHLNQFDELDSSTEGDIDDTDTRSLKQKEHGASMSTQMTDEQEEKLNEQFQRLVDETTLRNRKRASMSSARTPSSTTLAEDAAAYDQVKSSDVEDDYKDMPPLVTPEEANPIIRKAYTGISVWPEVPNFSQTHYLHNYADEFD